MSLQPQSPNDSSTVSSGTALVSCWASTVSNCVSDESSVPEWSSSGVVVGSAFGDEPYVSIKSSAIPIAPIISSASSLSSLFIVSGISSSSYGAGSVPSLI